MTLFIHLFINMIFAWLTILLGLVFLLQNIGMIPNMAWDIFWPILLILVGLSMLRKHDNCWCNCTPKNSKKK